jgi:beta-galactosidase/beta-glucuronidase
VVRFNGKLAIPSVFGVIATMFHADRNGSCLRKAQAASALRSVLQPAQTVQPTRPRDQDVEAVERQVWQNAPSADGEASLLSERPCTQLVVGDGEGEDVSV